MLKQSVIVLLIAAAPSSAKEHTMCPMQPSRLVMQLPKEGLTWLPGEESTGACDAVPANNWMRAASRTFDLLVSADGPNGSGRFWTVTVALAGKQQTDALRGACFVTATVGWRTLQRFSRSPLPWVSDLEANGTADLIVWGSFALSQEATLAEFGLVAWVYDVDKRGQVAIDWKLSRRIAGELAAEYRTPLKNAQQLQEQRNKLAQALEAFATGLCEVPGERAR